MSKLLSKQIRFCRRRWMTCCGISQTRGRTTATSRLRDTWTGLTATAGRPATRSLAPARIRCRLLLLCVFELSAKHVCKLHVWPHRQKTKAADGSCKQHRESSCVTAEGQQQGCRYMVCLARLVACHLSNRVCKGEFGFYFDFGQGVQQRGAELPLQGAHTVANTPSSCSHLPTGLTVSS